MIIAACIIGYAVIAAIIVGYIRKHIEMNDYYSSYVDGDADPWFGGVLWPLMIVFFALRFVLRYPSRLGRYIAERPEKTPAPKKIKKRVVQEKTIIQQEAEDEVEAMLKEHRV